MKLKCRINGKEYDIVQGATFADEFNETLDSGNVIITHIKKIKNLKPYNDVYIWSGECSFLGYDKDTEKTIFLTADGRQTTDLAGAGIFYKHLLVNQFSETMLNLSENGKKSDYEYKIQLFSETKGLEIIQLPNLSITQPLGKNKKTIWFYLNKYVNLYSPKVKKIKNKENKTWSYEKKYKISETLKDIFDNTFAPEMTLNNPNLRDILSKLMIVKDMIPYVVDDVIYAMDISKTTGTFNYTSNDTNFISGSLSSANYCDSLKTTYSDALGEESSSRVVEYLGFRNDGNSLMTLGNMRIETRFPIYKINKILMCYYKKIDIVKLKDGTKKTARILCKQNITPLVKLNTERNVLSEDWEEFTPLWWQGGRNAEEMSKYKMCTVGYDIGSKSIEGWGTQYKYPIKYTEWDNTVTYIQNIFANLDYVNPIGTETDLSKLKEELNINYEFEVKTKRDENGYIFIQDCFENLLTPYGSDLNNSLKLKSFFFQIDYQSFYSGTLIHSKDDGEDSIFINDNPSSSLTLLEKDGKFQKEKVNRFGNKGITVSSRYENIKSLQNVGSTFDYNDEKNIIIYHREYQIWDNYIVCNYLGTKDYVLKNYFTSVFAKHRTWNLIPYNESVKRAENRKMLLLLSKKEQYYEQENIPINFENFATNKYGINVFVLKKLFSCFDETPIPKNSEKFDFNSRINSAFIITYDAVTSQYVSEGKRFLTDLNAFVSGNSLCFNLVMNDNISAGNYIKRMNPPFNSENNPDNFDDGASISWETIKYLINGWSVKDDYTGTSQGWHSFVDDSANGEIDYMGFYVAKSDWSLIDRAGWFNDDLDVDVIMGKPSYIPTVDVYDYANKFPLKDTSVKVSNATSNSQNAFPEYYKIGNMFDIQKDNKEWIDMTYQIEPITNDDDVHFSPYFMKLSELLGNKYKIENNAIKKWAGATVSVPRYAIDDFDSNGKRRFIISIKFDADEDNETRIKENLERFSDEPIEFKEYGGSVISAPEVLPESWDYENSIQEVRFYFETLDKIVGDDMYITMREERKMIENGSLKDSTATGLFVLKRKVNPSNGDVYYIGTKESNVINGKPTYYNCSTGKTYDPEKPFELGWNEPWANFLIKETVELHTKNMYICVSKSLDKMNMLSSYKFAKNFDGNHMTYKIGDIVNYKNKIWRCKKEINSPHDFKESEWEIIENTKINSGNLYEITDDQNFWKKRNIALTGAKVSDVFSVEEDENNRPYINVKSANVPKLYFEEELGDYTTFVYGDYVSYWYLDEDGYLKFVFGTKFDIDNEEDIKIYISSLGNRKKTIFNEFNQPFAENLNYLKNEDKKYNTSQYYDITYPLEENGEWHIIEKEKKLEINPRAYNDYEYQLYVDDLKPGIPTKLTGYVTFKFYVDSEYKWVNGLNYKVPFENIEETIELSKKISTASATAKIHLPIIAGNVLTFSKGSSGTITTASGPNSLRLAEIVITKSEQYY